MSDNDREENSKAQQMRGNVVVAPSSDALPAGDLVRVVLG